MPIGVAALLSRSVQATRAGLASCITPHGRAPAPADMDPHSAAGLAALNGEVSRRAAAIAFLSDFWPMMILTAPAIPCPLFRGRTARPPDIGSGRGRSLIHPGATPPA